MRNSPIKLVVILLLALSSQSMQAAAQPREPANAVQEIADLTEGMAQFATILRLSEDIAFWQGVAIMGGQYDWEFSKNTQGTEIFSWTYRLTNSLVQTLNEGIRASQSIARSRVLTDEEKQAGKDLYLDYQKMRALGEEVNRLVREDNIAAASALYESEVLQLRRDISGAAASNAAVLRDRAKRIALDIRLGK